MPAPEREITRWFDASRAGKIGEERRQFGVNLEPVIDRAHPRHVFFAHLLGEDQPAPQRRLQPLDRGWHDIGHHPRALAAADHEQAKRTGGVGRSKFHRGRGEDRRAHRRADGGGLAGQTRIAIEHAGQRGRDRADAARQEPVGAAEHRIGLVNDAGHAEQSGRQQRRQCRIAAEADHGLRA